MTLPIHLRLVLQQSLQLGVGMLGIFRHLLRCRHKLLQAVDAALNIPGLAA